MNENTIYYNYGVLQGRLQALKAYCESKDFIDKSAVMAIVGLDIDLIEDEEEF